MNNNIDETKSKVIGVVVAKDIETARAAAKLVKASPRKYLEELLKVLGKCCFRWLTRKRRCQC